MVLGGGGGGGEAPAEGLKWIGADDDSARYTPSGGGRSRVACARLLNHSSPVTAHREKEKEPPSYSFLFCYVYVTLLSIDLFYIYIAALSKYHNAFQSHRPARLIQ